MGKAMRARVRRAIVGTSRLFWAQQQAGIRAEIDRLRLQISNIMPDNPVLRGFKVYSQTDEDGILEYILSKIQPNKTFVEIGCSDGLENNTHYLLLKGYSGCWVDGSIKMTNFLTRQLNDSLANSSNLKVITDYVRVENVIEIIEDACAFNNTEEPDVFSLDIDGNDLFILEKSLHDFSPKIICVEYNAKFPPPARLSITYNASHTWAGDDYHGATLQMLCDCLESYRLVCCNISGVNAFFVRKDLAEPFAQYSTEELFQPPRFDLVHLSSGHPPSLKWLNNVLLER